MFIIIVLRKHLHNWLAPYSIILLWQLYVYLVSDESDNYFPAHLHF